LRKVRDGDQNGVLDASKPDHSGMAASDALVMGRKPKKTMYQMAKLPVATAGQ
jgi:hypothetical protein